MTVTINTPEPLQMAWELRQLGWPEDFIEQSLFATEPDLKSDTYRRYLDTRFEARTEAVETDRPLRVFPWEYERPPRQAVEKEDSRKQLDERARKRTKLDVPSTAETRWFRNRRPPLVQTGWRPRERDQIAYRARCFGFLPDRDMLEPWGEVKQGTYFELRRAEWTKLVDDYAPLPLRPDYRGRVPEFREVRPGATRRRVRDPKHALANWIRKYAEQQASDVSAGYSANDLAQEAWVGVLKASTTYSPAGPFDAYAQEHSKGEIQNYKDKCGSFKVPREVRELRRKIYGAECKLEQKLRRAPTPSEIAAEVGIGVDEVLATRLQVLSLEKAAYEPDNRPESDERDPESQPEAEVIYDDEIADEDEELAGLLVEPASENEAVREMFELLTPAECEALLATNTDGATRQRASRARKKVLAAGFRCERWVVRKDERRSDDQGAVSQTADPEQS